MTDDVDALEGDHPAESRGAVVFLADASAEAERVARSLRAEGYRVIDVPTSLLLARVASQRPEAIVLDGDAAETAEVLAGLRGLIPPETRVFVLARIDSAEAREHVLSLGATEVFDRPVDEGVVLARVEALVPVVVSEPVASSSQPPPSPSRGPTRATSSEVPRPDSIAGQIQRAAAQVEAAAHASSSPPSDGLSAPPSPPRGAALDVHLDPVAWAGASAPVGMAISEELASLLAAADSRIGAAALPSSEPPSPDEEVDRVLPPEILAELDEPMDIDDPDGSSGGGVSTPGTPGASTSIPEDSESKRHVLSAPQGGGAAGASTRIPEDSESKRHVLSALQVGEGPWPSGHGLDEGGAGRYGRLEPNPSARDVDEAGPRTQYETDREPETRRPAPPRAAPIAPVEPVTAPADAARAPVPEPRPTSSWPAPRLAARGEPEPPPKEIGSRVAQVLGEGDAARTLASAVAERSSLSLCFDDGACLRRAVLRDGDFVTAASTADGESVLAFLAELGDLPQDLAKKLAGKIPPFGRHAGAALVAHGHLSQDRLWDVLRSHAEWIIARILLVPSGVCVSEADPPGRLRAEPAVFGGSTGAEVLVELSRRVLAPESALVRLGGSRARFDKGARFGLLMECALSATERGLIERAMGGAVGDIVTESSRELAAVLVPLVDLGVLSLLSAGRQPSAPPPDAPDPLDEDALRARVRARLELIEEGDYFTVLGVSQAATPYDIRRAYLELRRSLEPGKILTAATADLRPSIETILDVLDEAYEILKDPIRRERYRRAIAATPSG